MNGSRIIGLDIGGTFTDAVMLDPVTGALVCFKSLTTPDDPARGALAAVRSVLARGGARPGDVGVLLHATTLVSNALIERKGARTALVTTAGFRDTLEIGREKKYDIYDLQIDKPQPLVAREHRIEVRERLLADGTPHEPLDARSVRAACEAVRASKAEAVAICLLHAYVNPAHEQALREHLQRELPHVAVSISSDVLPEVREYERMSTTVANAYVQPLVARYLHRFVEGLRADGVRGGLFIMLSEGGIAAPEVVRRFPVRICESGPAAGAVTAATVGRQCDFARVLSFDMGGMTAKTCLVNDHHPVVTTECEVARIYRFKKGSGIALRMPVIDLTEIGAGGGSIVRVDELGLLKVGPDSAGADPGPACYGRGGQLPTVTDADLVLGLLDARSFLGGRMTLHLDRARAAISSAIAEPLGMSVDRAALGIHEMVNEMMANASRVHAVEHGFDPAAYTMVAFGGAGPVHAWGVAHALRVERIVVPPTAGVGSATGLLLAPRSYRIARTYGGRLEGLDWHRVERLYTDMTDEALAVMQGSGVDRSQVRMVRRADMRYSGQRKELLVDLPEIAFGDVAVAPLRERFEQRYERVYHRRHEGHPVEVLCWRLAATGPAIVDGPPIPSTREGGRAARPSGWRRVMFAGGDEPRECPVYRRDALAVGCSIEGLAVIEEEESTTVVGPGAQASVDEWGNIVMDLGGHGAGRRK